MGVTGASAQRKTGPSRGGTSFREKIYTLSEYALPSALTPLTGENRNGFRLSTYSFAMNLPWIVTPLVTNNGRLSGWYGVLITVVEGKVPPCIRDVASWTARIEQKCGSS